MVLKPEVPESRGPRGPVAIALALWRELLLPVLVAFAVLLIAVALIEGPPLEQFLYAVF
jgi:hypothetical protein